MPSSELTTIQALRGDLALQIARAVIRSGESQTLAAKRLAIPQPTLSKIMNGRVKEVSLELLIRIAVRAGLPVVMLTGKDPSEAGVYVSGEPVAKRATRSKVAEASRQSLAEGVRRLTPEQRLEALMRHSELVTALHRAAPEQRAPRRTTPGRRSR